MRHRFPGSRPARFFRASADHRVDSADVVSPVAGMGSRIAASGWRWESPSREGEAPSEAFRGAGACSNPVPLGGSVAWIVIERRANSAGSRGWNSDSSGCATQRDDVERIDAQGTARTEACPPAVWWVWAQAGGWMWIGGGLARRLEAYATNGGTFSSRRPVADGSPPNPKCQLSSLLCVLTIGE